MFGMLMEVLSMICFAFVGKERGMHGAAWRSIEALMTHCIGAWHGAFEV